jgi:hypothetical protein
MRRGWPKKLRNRLEQVELEQGPSDHFHSKTKASPELDEVLSVRNSEASIVQSCP